MISASRPSTRLRLAPVAWRAVHFDDAFWAPRIRLVRERTLPALHQQCLRSGRIDALRLTWIPGKHPRPHPYWDSDVAKWIEACCAVLATHPDTQLDQVVEEVVQLIAAAQQPDGYVNSYITTVNPDGRWMDLRDGHELYCAGHLIEAGVTHFLATGRRTLLEVGARYADYIATVFGTGSGQKRGYCGHPEIELALVRLYRATGGRSYLELSQYFVDERGQEPYYFDQEGAERSRPRGNDGYYRRHGLRGPELRLYNQSHAPVREQHQVVGHAVRAMYLYSAMADLATETDDAALLEACERLWSHLVSTRLYLTGGIGSSARNEGFSSDYDLPNASGYAETCASIGLVFWAQRMLELTGDGRYADVLERTLYNAVAAAIGSDGQQFSYANPLASDGRIHRQPWFDVACCPPNVARLLGLLGGYVYSQADTELAVHLYTRSTAAVFVGGQHVRVRQSTDYPWDGRVRLQLEPEHPARFGLRLRIPGWCDRATVRLNGESIAVRSALHAGYVRIERTWQSGDSVDLDLPMQIKRIYAHPSVAENAGRVALQRGPITYCFEQADNPVPLDRVRLPRSARIAANLDQACLGGVVVLQTVARVVEAEDWRAELYRADRPSRLKPWQLVAVPYAAWGNRSAGQMRVWIHEGGPYGDA